MQATTLRTLALHALRNAIIEGHHIEPASLASLPAEAAESLLLDISSILSPSDKSPGVADGDAALHPPLALVRCFYGSGLDRIRQVGATDAWASEVFGGGLRRLRQVSLLRARGLTAYGAGTLACAFEGTLLHLSITHCPSLSAAGVEQVCRCSLLRTLKLGECQLALDDVEVRPLLRLHELEELDLGGNPLLASAAAALCSDRSGRPLRCLRLWGSMADDSVALAAMDLPAPFEALDLSWCPHFSGEGAALLAVSLGDRLRELRIGESRCAHGELVAVLPALASLTALSLSGLPLSAADLYGAIALKSMRSLELRAARLGVGDTEAEADMAFDALLRRAPSLHELCIVGLAGGSLDRVISREEEEEEDFAPLGGDGDGDGNAGGEGDGDGNYGIGDGDGSTGTDAVATVNAASMSSRVRLVSFCASHCSFLSTHPPADASATTRSQQLAAMEDANPRLRLLSRALATTRSSLERLELAGCAASALWRSVPLQPSAGGMPMLRVLDLTDTNADGDAVRWAARAAPRLQELRLDHNALVTDDVLWRLGGLSMLRSSLTGLHLKATAVSANSLPALASLKALRVLNIERTLITPSQQRFLPSHFRAKAAAAQRERMLTALRDAPSTGACTGHGDDEGGLAEEERTVEQVQRYDATDLLTLQSSVYAQVPPRPLPSLPGIVRL